MKVAVSKEPPKRKRIWPWILLGSFVLTVVAPIAFIYGFFYEPDTKKVELQENFDVKNLGQYAMVDLMDTAKSEHKLSLSITENDLDNILDFALTKAGAKNNYVKKAYCKIKGNKYTFYVDVDGVVIKSRVKLTTICDESSDKSAFVFKVQDIALGRLSGIAGVARTLTSSIDYETMIQNVFKDIGLSMEFSKADWTLTYKKADLIKDLKGLAGGGDGDSSMLFSIVETLYDNNLVNFDFTTTNFLDVNVDLEPLASNEFVTDDVKHCKIKADEVDEFCKNRMITLIKNNIIGTDEETLKLVFTFLLRGYAPLSDDQKNQINKYDFSSVGIANNETYTPAYESNFVVNNDTSSLFNQMKDELIKLKDIVTSDTISNKRVELLDEDALNMYIASRDFSSSLVFMHRPTTDGYKLNYVLVDNFYCNIYSVEEEGKEKEQKAELVAKLNINGYHTSITLDTDAEVIDNGELKFTVKENGIRFGTIQSKELDEQFFDLIAKSINSSGGESIKADKENKSISFKFNSMVTDAKTSIHETLYAEAMKNMDNASLPVVVTAQRSRFNEFIDKSITECLTEILSTENVGIDINGKDREANGTMDLTIKSFDYKDKFKLKIKAAYESEFDESTRTIFAAAGFNIDSFTNTILGIK